MADKVSKFIFPVKSGNTIADKEFDVGGSGDTNTFVGTTAEWNALTTEQQNAYNCRVLTDDDLDTKNVIDNLNSDSSTDALSAKQGKVLKGLIDSMSESDYYRRYVTDWVGYSIDFIDNTSGKIMFTLTGVLTLKDDILTFDCAVLGTTNDYKGGRILNYTADLSSTFTELSNYEWDTGWIADNSIVPDDRACIGWCIIFNEGCDTPIDYVSGNGLKVRITHVMGFDERGYIKPEFLHFSAKIKPRTT